MMKGAEPIFIDNKASIGVLMLHGFTSTPGEFKELSAYMAEKGFNVYAPVVAGHGTVPADLMKTTSQDWLKSVKEAYIKLRSVSEKVFIIGNSFGSNLGFWLIKEFNNEPVGIITLDAPIFIRNEFLAYVRMNTYGLFRTYYQKSKKMYQADYIDMMDSVTYSAIPVKSIRDFLRFIKRETIPNLSAIKVPALITHSTVDPIIHPRSATYIYNHISSPIKKIHWFVSNNHAFTVDGHRVDVFRKILQFINEVTK
jgi:carboxylesterase